MKLLEVGKMPQTDEEALEYLPDDTPLLKSIVKGLYESRRGQGDTIQQALTFVFKQLVSKEKDS